MNLLLSSNGKSECKVCPAIKKWVQRKNDNNDNNTTAVKKDNNVDVRDEVVVVEEKTMEKEEMRDDPEEDINPSFNTSVSVESLVEHFENIKVVQETATSNTNTLTAVGSTDSDDTDAIRERARQIIMNARNGNMWDDNNDDDSDLSEAEEEEEEVERESEDSDDIDNKSSSTDFSTSAENVDIKTTFSSDSMEDAFLQQRAAAIINQARMNLLTNSDDGDEDDSTSMDEVEGKGDETESLLAPESPEEVVDETEAEVNPSSSSAEEETNTGMELHDAAIIIQSTTRGFLAKKQVLGLMFREYEEETNLDEFETLVNNPTEETDDDEKEEDDQYVDVDISVDKQEDTISEPEMLEPEPQQEEKLESVDVHVQSEAAVQLAPVAPESESLETSERFDTIDEMVIHDINQMKNAISPVVQEMKKALNSSQQKLSSTDVGKTAKSRGFFAELACKFDDAVSGALGRAVSCNMDVDSMLGFGEEYDELIEQGRAKYDAQLMLLVMQGWIDSHRPCPRCNKNFMLNPEDGDMMCAGCDDVGMINPDLTPAETYAPPSSQLVAMPEHLGCHNDWVDDAPVVTHHSPLPVIQEWSHANDDMENSSGDANVSKQLQDAKLRIEDAKKFIVSRSSNNHRMTPTRAHTAASPSRSVLGNMIPKHPASNQMSSPSYSQTYNNGMGSLMSAESNMTPGGTPNSGYRTPVVPDKVFFV